MTDHFDADGPALDHRLFGLPHGYDDAAIVVVPVPFDATASSRRGAMAAPEGIRYASAQVDLYDMELGEVWRHGITMDPLDPRVRDWNAAAREAVDEARRDGAGPATERANALCDRLEAWLGERTGQLLDDGKVPAILGGDHSVPLGAIRAALERYPDMGILQVDAHLDLRPTYESFRHSHASILYNVLRGTTRPPVAVHVGSRDVGPAEWARAVETPGLHLWPDHEISRQLQRGASWAALVDDVLAPLPQRLWMTFDIDGLDPSLCPGTGTPVPGGLTWRQSQYLLSALAESGRQVVGFDLCEVGPDEWDASVGARVLYRLCGVAARGL